LAVISSTDGSGRLAGLRTKAFGKAMNGPVQAIDRVEKAPAVPLKPPPSDCRRAESDKLNRYGSIPAACGDLQHESCRAS
jgi:hypothetical protein